MKVIVIGGGPGGAVCGAVLARAGHEVTLLEKQAFPRPHVGESLQPAGIELLDRYLGLGAKVAASGYARKYGAVYVWGRNREPWTVLFDEGLDGALQRLDESSLLASDFDHAWQVDRASFDSLILERAMELGVSVRQETANKVHFRDARAVGVEVEGDSLSADAVVDASGQSCLVARQLGLLAGTDDLRSTATYSYFEGAGGLEGPLARHVQYVVTIPDGWIWFIPVSPTRTSIGVVRQERSRLEDSAYRALLQKHLPMSLGTRTEPLHHVRDWSYRVSRTAGPGWVAVGDASGFVDPILSGGVDAAIRSGAEAALALHHADETGSPDPLVSYDRERRREVEVYLQMARYWYSNNPSMEGLFWEARRAVSSDSVQTPLRAFVYLTSGRYHADRQFKVFSEDQERRIFEQLGVRGEDVNKAVATRRLKKPRP